MVHCTSTNGCTQQFSTNKSGRTTEALLQWLCVGCPSCEALEENERVNDRCTTYTAHISAPGNDFKAIKYGTARTKRS